MGMNTYDVGDLIRVQGTFTYNNNASDPQVVLLKYKKPGANNSTVLTYGNNAEVQKASNGVYYVDLEIDIGGTWYYRWEGLTSGGNKRGAAQHSFLISQNNV